MRWMFSNPNCPQESRYYRESLGRIDAWWEAFQRHADRLEGLFLRLEEWDLPSWMERHLQVIDPHLMWEFGPAVRCSGHRLVITPEAQRQLRPLTTAILDRAPSMPDWEFYAYRLPEDRETAEMTVQARTGGSLEGMLFRASLGPQQMVDLTFSSPEAGEPNDEPALLTSLVAAEALLGEEIMEKWIGEISVMPLPNCSGYRLLDDGAVGTPRSPIALDRLVDTVGALISSVKDQTPRLAHWQRIENATWTMFRLDPVEAEDYPQQYDLFVAKTANGPLWLAAHGGHGFCSERFTHSGEVFCYLKVDGGDGLGQSVFADKCEIEDALDEPLRAAGLGCCIGGGTGLRYSYIDLALSDLRAGVELVKRVLREGRVPARSWIQFFDADLADEWVGIYDDGPPPPQ